MDGVHILENDAGDGPGHLLPALDAAGVDATLVRIHEGEPMPSPDDTEAIVILGGAMGVYESKEHPWITAEAELVRESVARDVPVLGICLGAQIVAHALGGRVFKADRPEVAVVTSTLSSAGARDPLATHLEGPYLSFHQDSFELPSSAVLLASSAAFPQVFRAGSALAIQSHPEVSVDDATEWGRHSPLPARAGVDFDEVMAEMKRSVLPRRAVALFSAWIAEWRAT